MVDAKNDLFRLLEENPNPVARVDQDGLILYANPACAPLLAYWERQVGQTLSPELQKFIRSTLAENEYRETDTITGDQTYLLQWVPVPGEPYLNIYGRNISRRKQAEQAPRNSEQLYRAIGESIDYGVWVCAPDGRNTYASESFLKLVGLTQEQCSNFGWGDVLHPDDADRTIAAWQECVRTGGVWDIEHRFRGVDGQWHPVLARGLPVRNEAGEITCWAGINLDIGRMKQAEEGLQVALARFRRIVDSNIIGFVTVKADGSILEANDYYLGMLGYTQEDLRTDRVSWIDMTPPEYLALDQHALQELKERGTCAPYQKEYFRKDGSRIWVLITDAMMPGPGEEFAAFVMDVSAQKALEDSLAGQRDALGRTNNRLAEELAERQRIEESLRKLARRLAAINRLDRVISSSLEIDQVYDVFVQEMRDLVQFDRTSIMLLDESGERWQILRQWTWSEPFFQLDTWQPVKGTAMEWVVKNQRAFLEGRLGEQVDWLEHKGLRAEGLQSRVLLPLIIQGKVIGLLSLASRQPEAYQPGDLELLLTLADQLAIAVQNARLYAQARLTAEELEQRVQARTAQLEATNKDLESFSYSVSHDLRAPLRAINGFAQILIRRHKDNLDEEGRHYLDNVVEASTRMGVLIDDLLLYSRIGRASVHRQTISMPDLFTQVLGDLSDRINERRATIQLPPPGSMPPISSDPTILSQIFSNILQNALTYHRPGVPLEIRVTFQEEPKQYLFGVRDNGIGIPDEYHQKIFNVFQRLHSVDEYPGTGIGLAIVKKSAELLNGQVWVDSAVGEGSTFWFQFPKE